MAIYQVPLVHDASLAKPGTFLYVAEIRTIRCRFRLPSLPEVAPLDVHVYFRGEKRHGMVRVRPLDECTFITGVIDPGEGRPRVELLLQQVPENVARDLLAV